MVKKIFKYNYIYILILFLLISWCFQLNLVSVDETYTLRLIQHSYSEIISLDAMDVHPPLYYIILKTFFNITFINYCSPFIQIIVARIFSIFCYIITIFCLSNLLSKIINKKTSAKLLLSSILFPMILYYATNIRMYSLAALFITCELFYIYKYNEENKIIYTVFFTSFAIFAAWTHYFSAVIAGFLLLYNFVYAFLHHNKKNVLSYLISGAVFFISFLPWLFISLNQIKSVDNNYWIKNSIFNYIGIFSYQRMGGTLGSIISNICTILLTFCFFTIIFKMIKQNKNIRFKKYYWMVFSTLVFTILLGFILSLLIRPIFIARYAYPIFIVFIVFNIPLIFNFLKLHEFKFIKYIFIISCSTGILLNGILGMYNIPKNYKIITNINQIKKLPGITYNAKNNMQSDQLMFSYLLPNKIIKTDDKKLIHIVQSKKLFNNVYPNIKFVNDKDK